MARKADFRAAPEEQGSPAFSPLTSDDQSDANDHDFIDIPAAEESSPAQSKSKASKRRLADADKPPTKRLRAAASKTMGATTGGAPLLPPSPVALAISNPAKRVLAGQSSPEPVGCRERTRLDKCEIIHFIDRTYNQKGLEPPPLLQMADEIHSSIPGLLIKDATSEKLVPKSRDQVLRFLRGIAENDCALNTTPAQFIQNAVGSLRKNGRLRYEEYRTSVEQSLAADIAKATVVQSAAPALAARMSGSSKGTLSKFNRRSGGLRSQATQPALVDGELGVGLAPPAGHRIGISTDHAEQSDDSGAQTSTTNKAQLRDAKEQPANSRGSSTRPRSLSQISNDSGGSSNGQEKQPQFRELQQPVASRPGQEVGSCRGPHGQAICQQHEWQLSASQENGTEAHISQRWFTCAQDSCTFEILLSSSDLDGMSRLLHSATRTDGDGRKLKKQAGHTIRNQTQAIVQPTRPFNDFRPDETRWELDIGRLEKGLEAMFWQAKSRVHQAFVARGIADRQPASFLIFPPPCVQQLYEKIVGNTNANTHKSVIASGASAEDLALSLFSAFLLRKVFHGPWGESFDQFQAKSIDGTTEVNRVLKEYRTDHDTVLRKAYFLRHLDKDWTQEAFGAVAEHLSNDFAMRLEKHLGNHHGPDGQSYGPSMYELADRFSIIIFQALVFKCKISSSREDMRFLWSLSGDDIDSEFVEGDQVEHERLLLTLFPGLQMSEESTHAEVVFKAQIVSSR